MDNAQMWQGAVPGVTFLCLICFFHSFRFVYVPDGMTQALPFPGGSGSEGPASSMILKYPRKGQRSMRVKPDGFTLSSRYARALTALARPFAPVSRTLRFPVHGSLLTKNFAGLLNAPLGNSKPAFIPDLKAHIAKIVLPGLSPIYAMDAIHSLSISGMRSESFNPRAIWGYSPGRRSRRERRRDPRLTQT